MLCLRDSYGATGFMKISVSADQNGYVFFDSSSLALTREYVTPS